MRQHALLDHCERPNLRQPGDSFAPYFESKRRIAEVYNHRAMADTFEPRGGWLYRP